MDFNQIVNKWKKKVGAPRSQGILKFQREIQIGLKAWIVIDVDKGEKMSRIVSWLLDGAENWATFCHQPPFYLPNPPLVKEQLDMGQFVFPKFKSLETKYKQDQVNCENINLWKIFSLENWKIFNPENYSPLKNIHLWKIFTPEKYSALIMHKIVSLSLSSQDPAFDKYSIFSVNNEYV